MEDRIEEETMAIATQLPALTVQTDYETWVSDVRNVLASTQMDLEVWQDNWLYDLRKDYEASVSAPNAAARAHEYWWQHLLAESWT